MGHPSPQAFWLPRVANGVCAIIAAGDLPMRLGREDIIGKWLEEKLGLLEKHLQAYARIINNQKRRWLKAFHCIDAFAGSGQVRAKDCDGG